MQKKHFILVFICFIALAATLCMLTEHTNTTTRKSLIVCTTSMIGDAVAAIGGDLFEYHVLMGPGIDPHLYKAREGDVLRFSRASLIVFNGIHLEGKMATLLDRMNRYQPTYALSDALDNEQLIPHDPHIWHDVKLWIQSCEGICTTLCSICPEHTQQILNNWNSYKRTLRELDEWIRTEIDTIPAPSRILITAHDAFSYFGRSYGIQVRGLAGISTDSDISIADVQELAYYMHEKKIKALFVESSIPKRSIKAVQDACSALGWNVIIGEELYSDALGDDRSDADTYVKMIKNNVDAIVRSLA